MHLAPKDLHATRRGDNPNRVHKCQNGKIVHTHFGLAHKRRLLRVAHVVFQPWGPMSVTKLLKMAKNAHTHGWGK